MADSSNPTPRDAPDAPGVGVRRNYRALALGSFLLSLVYLLGVTLFVLGGGSLVGLTTVGATTPPAYWVGSKLEFVDIPALIAAIISTFEEWSTNDGWSSQDVGPGNKGSDALATECVQCRNLGAFSPT
jgi:hypothetical protein